MIIETKDGTKIDTKVIRACIPKLAKREPRDKVIEALLDALDAVLSIPYEADASIESFIKNAMLDRLKSLAGVVEE